MPVHSKISVKPAWPEGDKPRHRAYLFIQAIPRTTKDAFKKKCQEHPRETMRDAIIRLMRFYVYSDRNIPDLRPHSKEETT